MSKIVVGVDGSESSRQAFSWALSEAHSRAAEVIAVHAWQRPTATTPWFGILAIPPMVDLRDEAAFWLERVFNELTGDSEVVVHRKVVEGPAAEALIKASEDADLLVVGSRGLGGFGGLLLGSVGVACAHHARCPVVIVPHDTRRHDAKDRVLPLAKQMAAR